MEIRAYRRRANYYETDQMGIIHHSNYIRWFEEARLDMLEQIGLGYARMEEDGIMIPVLSVNCEYRRMVKFNDEVEIRVKVTAFTGIKFTLAYELYDLADGELCTVGSSSHCFFDRNYKLIFIKKTAPHIYQRFKELAQ